MAEELKTKKPPVHYSRALGLKICELIASDYRLREIEEMPGMPSRVNIVRWANKNVDGFGERYERAFAIQLTLDADGLKQIADDSRNDWIERRRHNGEKFVDFNKEAVARSAQRIDVRKFLMGKLLPKFAERINHNHSSEPVEHHHRHVHRVEDLKALPLDDLAKLYREEVAEAPETRH